jgi:hypothetical protein
LSSLFNFYSKPSGAAAQVNFREIRGNWLGLLERQHHNRGTCREGLERSWNTFEQGIRCWTYLPSSCVITKQGIRRFGKWAHFPQRSME